MRNALKLMIGLLFITVLASAQGPADYRPASWSGAATTTLIANASDTSDVFQLISKFKMNGYTKERAPATLAWLVYATQGDNTDSTNVTFYVDFGNSTTGPWIADTIGSTTATDVTGSTVTGLKMTDGVFAKYARIRAVSAAASGDTSAVGVELYKIFND